MVKANKLVIRKAADKDRECLCRLHIASIQHFCANAYPEDTIQDWVSSKSPSAYLADNEQQIIYVAEANTTILGFGILNLQSHTIDSLYLRPGYAGQGLGKVLLETLEAHAKTAQISELYLNSTLNAHHFYQRMHYQKLERSTCKLRSGTELACIKMKKSLV